MLKMVNTWRAWRRRCVDHEAEYWQGEARRCALAAHAIDPMQQPLLWGRLQNRANWAKHNARAAMAKATGSAA